EGELMTHDEPFFMAPDDKHDLISGTCSHLPWASLRSAPTYKLHKFYQSPRYRPWITASNALHRPAGGARMVR
ncbi:hypothetical protein, partial [Aeromonas media]